MAVAPLEVVPDAAQAKLSPRAAAEQSASAGPPTSSAEGVDPFVAFTGDADATTSSGHYVDVDGHAVQSPTPAPRMPAGASALCTDGSYSFSHHRRGTCSHHGGVAEWL